MASRYRLDKLLGQGGSGAVFLAHHLKLDRPVAVKVLHAMAPDTVAAFEEEARLAASLDHPNLARVLDFFEEGGELVLVTEFIAGHSLDKEPMPVAEPVVMGWMAQVMDVLEFLHTRQPPVILRDLKPANLMLSPDGRVRLIDFGISKRLRPGQLTHAMIRGMGTEGFSPLEQYGSASTDQRSDLYALGATAYNLLSGQVPPDAVGRATQNLALPRLSVSEPTWRWLSALLELHPDRRPRSVAAARGLLRTTVQPAPKKAKPKPKVEPEWMDDFR